MIEKRFQTQVLLFTSQLGIVCEMGLWRNNYWGDME